MHKKLKYLLIVSVAMLLVGIIGLNVLAYRHAYAMMHFKIGTDRTREPEKLTLSQKIRVIFSGVNLPRPKTNLAPVELGQECKALTISCTNGIRLGAWHCPRKDSRLLVLLFHGYGGEKTGALPEARAFLDMGYSVLLVDFRGSGESSESYTTVGFKEAEDVAAAVRYAQEHLSPSKIVLYGQSMGAAAVLRSIHSCEVRPNAIIVEAVFDNLLSTVRHRFEAMGVPSFPCAQLLVFWGGYQAGFNRFSHNPVQYAASVDCPILFLHGAADSRAHVEEARHVFDAVHSRKQFKEFPGIGHAPAVVRFPSEWKETVRRFLSEAENKPDKVN